MIKNRICIVGSNGMLGQRIIEFYSGLKNVELFACSFENESFISDVNYLQIDITSQKDVQKLIHQFYPDYIINAAAFTNVDKCESEKELSWKVNVTGVENLVKYGGACDAHLIHISTDYVFDGKNGPYSENDKPNPISSYGRSKLASENILLSNKIKSTIVRTNVLYGPAKHGRPDFVKWVVGSLSDNKEIKIVTDQINNPTFLDDLVQGISKLIEFDKKGLYNIGGAEFLSRYDFTQRIADYFNLDKSLIKKIVTSDLNQPAPRPLKSGLINLKAETELSYKPHSIEESLLIISKELNF
ncbi:MAG: dTDP-4-dehydrorhamnose reductase [Bacteroidetes bacterium]|nr:dTDP-4-dehydrorhamnose reductase [Bacteroidota bacterium]